MNIFATEPPSADAAGPQDWALIGWIVAAAIAIAAIVIAVLAARRWGNRRAGAEWYVDAVPLLAGGVGNTLLEVTFRDVPVEDPVLVTFGIVNTGPRDITSDMFDAGRPILVRLGAPLYGVTRHEGNPDLLAPALGTSAEDAILQFRPRLLKRTDAWQFSAVVSGVPKIQIEAPLIDTDLKELAKQTLTDGILGAVVYSASGVLGEVASILIGRRR